MKGLWILEMLGVLVGISLANGVAQSQQGQEGSAHPGLGLREIIRVIPA